MRRSKRLCVFITTDDCCVLKLEDKSNKDKTCSFKKCGDYSDVRKDIKRRKILNGKN